MSCQGRSSSAGLLLVVLADLVEVFGLADAALRRGRAQPEALNAKLALLQQRKLGAGADGQGRKADGESQGSEGVAQEIGKQPPGIRGGKALPFAGDPLLRLLKHGVHLGLEQGRG